MSLPKGFKRLEYIQSSGTQYIDTGVSAPEGFRIICDVVLTSISNSLNMLFGAHDTNDPYYRNFLAATNGGKWEIGAYNPHDFGSVAINTKYSIDVCTISGAVGCSVNGVNQNVDNSIAVSHARSSRTVYLFGLNYTGGLLPTNMKLYGLQMYLDANGENMVRDFVPCVTADGEVGLYDRVFHEFYRNAGTGSFIAGPELYGNDENTLLLLHGEDLTDSSDRDIAIINNGAGVSPNQSKFGGSSIFFNGTGCLLIPNATADFGDGEFTIDWWEYCTGDSGMTRFAMLWDQGSAMGMSVGYDLDDLYMSKTIGSWNMLSATSGAFSVTQNEWVHWALVRKGTSVTTYRNGKKFYTATISGALSNNNSSRYSIGAHSPSNPRYFIGYIDEFRISNVARWTGDFVPNDKPYTKEETAPRVPTNFRVEASTNTQVTLAWDPMEEVLGYRLYRSGQLLAETEETSVSVAVEPFAGAVFTLTAYNENGESAGTSLTHYSIPENPLLYLITDRTAQDVTNGTEKGSYNAADLNRVGAAMAYLRDRFNANGYDIQIDPKTTWWEMDVPTDSDMTLYLGYLGTLKSAITLPAYTPESPASMEDLTYSKANDIETILEIIDAMITLTVNAYWYSGELYSGEAV